MFKIYGESVKRWAIKAGIPITASIIFLYIFYTISIGAMVITGYSGDTICAGTLEDPCYAYINFTMSQDVFWYPENYDPWGRSNQLSFDPSVNSWLLQRSWGKSWRTIPMDKSCTGTWCGAPDNKGTQKYSIAWRKDRTYQIRIVSYKKPWEDVKWSFGPIDPIFKGIGKQEDYIRFVKDNGKDRIEAGLDYAFKEFWDCNPTNLTIQKDSKNYTETISYGSEHVKSVKVQHEVLTEKEKTYDIITGTNWVVDIVNFTYPNSTKVYENNSGWVNTYQSVKEKYNESKWVDGLADTESGKCNKIRVYADLKIGVGERNIHHSMCMYGYCNENWTWWNTSYLKRTCWNLTNPDGADKTNITFEFDLNVGEFELANSYFDFEWANDSEIMGWHNFSDINLTGGNTTMAVRSEEVKSDNTSQLCAYYNNSDDATFSASIFDAGILGDDFEDNNIDDWGTGSPFANRQAPSKMSVTGGYVYAAGQWEGLHKNISTASMPEWRIYYRFRSVNADEYVRTQMLAEDNRSEGYSDTDIGDTTPDRIRIYKYKGGETSFDTTGFTWASTTEYDLKWGRNASGGWHSFVDGTERTLSTNTHDTDFNSITGFALTARRANERILYVIWTKWCENCVTNRQAQEIQADTTIPDINWAAPTTENGTEPSGKDYIFWNITVTEDASAFFDINGTNQTGTCINASTDTSCWYNETGFVTNVTRCTTAYAFDEAGNGNSTERICRTFNISIACANPTIYLNTTNKDEYYELGSTVNITAVGTSTCDYCISLNLTGFTDVNCSQGNVSYMFASIARTDKMNGSTDINLTAESIVDLGINRSYNNVTFDIYGYSNCDKFQYLDQQEDGDRQILSAATQYDFVSNTTTFYLGVAIPAGNFIIKRYELNWSYIDDWLTSGTEPFTSITTNISRYWVVEYIAKNVSLRYENTTVEQEYDLSVLSGGLQDDPWVITKNETNFFVFDDVDEIWYVYDSKFSFIADYNFTMPNEVDICGGEILDNSFYMTNCSNNMVYNYSMNGTLNNLINLTLRGFTGTESRGMAYEDGRLWIGSQVNNHIFKTYYNSTMEFCRPENITIDINNNGTNDLWYPGILNGKTFYVNESETGLRSFNLTFTTAGIQTFRIYLPANITPVLSNLTISGLGNTNFFNITKDFNTHKSDSVTRFFGNRVGLSGRLCTNDVQEFTASEATNSHYVNIWTDDSVVSSRNITSTTRHCIYHYFRVRVTEPTSRINNISIVWTGSTIPNSQSVLLRAWDFDNNEWDTLDSGSSAGLFYLTGGITDYSKYIRNDFVQVAAMMSFTNGDYGINTDYFNLSVNMNISFPENVSVDNGFDGDYEYNSTGELNTSNSSIAISISNTETQQHINESTGNFFPLDIGVKTDQIGIINIKIDFRYNLSTFNFTGVNITGTNGVALFNADVWGKLNLFSLEADFEGDIDYNITVNNSAQSAFIRWSNYSLVDPNSWTDELIFYFPSNNSKNITPWGQTDTIPALNISSEVSDKNMTFGVRLNASLPGCLAVTITNTTDKGDGFALTTSFQEFYPNLTAFSSIGARFFADATNCAGGMNIIYPVFRSYCDRCLRNW